MRDFIDTRGNGPRPEPPEAKYRPVSVQIVVSSGDVLKMAYIAAGTVLTGILIDCSYKAGAMFLALGLVGFLIFIWLMVKYCV